MSEKEATVYLIDVSRSMSKKHSGRSQTDLEWALQYVWDKITNVVFTGRKTLMIGVVGLGTDGTSNDMASQDDSYKHISVLQPISQILMPELRSLPKVLTPSKTDDRDVLSGIIIAVDMMMKHCKHLKYKKRIVVITNATGHIDADDVESTAEQFKNHDIELVLLGIDFDDPDYGTKEEDKSATKAENERTLKKLVDLSGGMFGTMQEAIDQLSRPDMKPIRATPTYRGQLRLGDPEQYDTALSIDVERYFKVQTRRPPTASSFVIRENTADDDQGLQSVHSIYKYSAKLENGETKELSREELAKGYEYGRTAVAIMESEQNITKLETSMGYDILGFIPMEHVERYMLLDNSNVVVAQRGNDKAALALSSLVHALFELGSVAVGRLVKKDMQDPILTILSPLVEADLECLVENVLPFAEDVRSYRFPPLDKVLTVSGKELTEHRNLPNQKLMTSMSDFVDNMTLMNDDEEMMAMEDTFSPVLHRVEGAIKFRAIHGPEKFPDEPEMFKTYREQPEELRDRSQKALEKLIEAADVKKVQQRAKGRRRYRDTEKPISGLDVSELLRKEKRDHVSPDNAIPEFIQMIETAADEKYIATIVQQMGTILTDWVRTSYGEKNYGKVVEGLGTVRQWMQELEMPDLYNNMVQELKEKILSKQLGGDRALMWFQARKNKLGLISSDECKPSKITAEAAHAFLDPKPGT
ncbi:uncharacterized protein PV06_10845 [Exophiala oligosperma]|uniref:ATP-dependent DNA helicase II subunit 2 n=2 Tax=Chaetothyriales TaxID=34395 RepID=A0A0D2DMK7_9EURO|nr:uncharacterized protein PV06_10845 [Exophiala oligosperma]KAJ9639757.1 ATP-dependent DNA helicase yku80 [Knufia peltigerae]KIW36944.1 hypothetical protein PV06_10845 [Exophiala oligosperma]